MKAPSEQALVRQLLDCLRIRGVFCWRQNQGRMPIQRKDGRTRLVRFAHVDGISDIIGVLPGSQANPAGRMLCVEAKRPRGKMTADQSGFLERVTSRGGLALCVHSLDELIAALEAEGY